MPVVGPVPSQGAFGVAPGPQPFNRKNWDNPIKYKLDRAYGDEFEYLDFRSLNRRWKVRNGVAADFYFPGGSSIDWLPTQQGDSMYEACPAGDFEALLEFSYGSPGQTSNGMFPAISFLDASGNGVGFSVYNNGLAYSWNVASWVYSSTVLNGVSNGQGITTGHIWIAVKKNGTSVSGRVSNNGSSFTSPATAGTLSVTPVFLVISRLYFASQPGWTSLHRLNIYPGPTFFPG